MLIFLQNFLFTSLIFTNVIGYGFVLNLLFKEQEKKFIILFFYGTILMIAIAILVNFFIPLSTNLTNLLFIIFTLIGCYKIFKDILYSYNLKLTFFLIFFASIIIFKSYPYNDYEIYHLPFIETIRNFKIIFGLSNFNYKFGHTSIFQYISALQYNSLMKLDSYVYFSTVLISIILAEILLNFRKSNNLIIKFIAYIFLVNYFIHANRYGALGNDFPAHAISFFSYILFFEIIYNDSKKTKFHFFIFTILIASFGKLSLIINILLLIPLFLIKKNIFKLNLKIFIFISIVLTSFTIKNFINTSCIFYPISFTCFETKWSPDKFDFSHPDFVSLYSKVGNKDFPIRSSENKVIPFDSNKIISKEINKNKKLYNQLSEYEKKIFQRYAIYNEYDKFQNWSKRHYENHFKRKIFNDLVIFLFLNIFLFFLYNKNYKFKISKDYNINKLKKEHLYFFIFILMSCIIWFISSPLLRYGISYLYILISIPFFIFIIFFSTSIEKISKYFNFLIVITLIFSLTDNIIRINKFRLKDNYTNTIVPIKNPFYEKTNVKNSQVSKVKKPFDYYCSFSPPLCISSDMNVFLESDFKFSNRKGYLFIIK